MKYQRWVLLRVATRRAEIQRANGRDFHGITTHYRRSMSSEKLLTVLETFCAARLPLCLNMLINLVWITHASSDSSLFVAQQRLHHVQQVRADLEWDRHGWLCVFPHALLHCASILEMPTGKAAYVYSYNSHWI